MNFGRGWLMVWEVFSYDFKLPICFMSTKMNSEMYTELLEDVLLTQLDVYPDKNYVFSTG